MSIPNGYRGSHTFKTSVGDEVKVTVEFNHYNYPERDEYTDILHVMSNGTCILEILSDKVIKALEAECFEHLGIVRVIKPPPPPPPPPPPRIFRDTFFSGLVETAESLKATRDWLNRSK